VPPREATKVLWRTRHRWRRQRCARPPGRRWTPQSRGGHGRRWWCRRSGSSNRRAGPFPPWTPVSLGQQSAVRPAGGDRPDEKTLDGQVGGGDHVTAADLGPDAATRLSLNELAGMDCNRHGDCKQYRERCPFADEPAVCVRHDSLVVVSEGLAHIACARRRPIHPPSTGIMAARAGVGPRGTLENRAGSPADRARRARSIPPGASSRR
jgi:hypothetical protein